MRNYIQFDFMRLGIGPQAECVWLKVVGESLADNAASTNDIQCRLRNPARNNALIRLFAFKTIVNASCAMHVSSICGYEGTSFSLINAPFRKGRRARYDFYYCRPRVTDAIPPIFATFMSVTLFRVISLVTVSFYKCR